MDKIIINNLEVFAKHGVFPEENVLGQKFLISLVLYTDTRKAGRTDDLNLSINYGEVSAFSKKFMEENTYMLIEKVAEELAERLLLEFELLEKVDVKISKPWAPIGMPVENISVEISRGWHDTFIALGSNLGDKKKYLDDAVEKMQRIPQCKVVAVADYIETEPYGGVEQDTFLNSAAKIRTLLEPGELLDFLHEIENEANRTREIHWGPRTLDLDILFYDKEIIDTKDLLVPHIDMANRDFVLIPMNQLAPYFRHPITNKTISQMLEDLTK